MSNGIAALSREDTTPQNFAEAHYSSAVHSNAANIGERKTWTQSEFYTWQNSVTGQGPPKCTSTEDGQTLCKVWFTSIERLRYSNEAKMRNPLKFAGAPQTPEPISAVSGPTFTTL